MLQERAGQQVKWCSVSQTVIGLKALLAHRQQSGAKAKEACNEEESIYGRSAFSLKTANMSVCKPGAQVMLEEEVPGDGIICRDGDSARPREVIQQQITSLIAEFLQSSIYKEGSL